MISARINELLQRDRMEWRRRMGEFRGVLAAKLFLGVRIAIGLGFITSEAVILCFRTIMGVTFGEFLISCSSLTAKKDIIFVV